MKAYQYLAEELEKKIRAGIFKTMSRLPPERELAAEFEVSRTTVREALTALEAAGIVSIKDRSGAYVLPFNEKRKGLLSQLKEEVGPHEVLQLRRMIEGEACFLVAMNGSEASIRKIKKACKANAAVPLNDTPEFHRASKAFHIAIAEGAENSLFVELVEYLWEQKGGPLWANWYRSTRSRSNRMIVLANNQETTDAIAARRPQAAQTSMQRHIDWMITRFLSY